MTESNIFQPNHPSLFVTDGLKAAASTARPDDSPFGSTSLLVSLVEIRQRDNLFRSERP